MWSKSFTVLLGMDTALQQTPDLKALLCQLVALCGCGLQVSVLYDSLFTMTLSADSVQKSLQVSRAGMVLECSSAVMV